jgi:hypothetical protein
VLRVAALVAVVCGMTIAIAEDRDEPPPHFTASTLLDPAIAHGPHHDVGETVRTDGYFHEFTLTSPYGAFEANGRSQLSVRIQEIGALAALDDVSKSEVFLKAAGQSVVKIGKGVASVVTKPSESVKGIGAGFKRFGVNLGRRTQRAVDSATNESPSDGTEPEGDSATESAAMSVLGVSSAMRRWAAKVGVDPYTTNVVLRDALTSIAKVDAAGSIATKVVIPIPPVVGMTSKVGHLVWEKDPEELRKINEQRLRDLSVTDDDAKKLFVNRWFTLTYQTRLIAALHAVRAAGSADYVTTAAEARSEREALFFVESAEMLEQFAARERVERILTDSRALVAIDRRRRALALLPLDWVRWTTRTEQALRDIGTRARKELGATDLVLMSTGHLSDRATTELVALGWTVGPA